MSRLLRWWLRRLHKSRFHTVGALRTASSCAKPRNVVVRTRIENMTDTVDIEDFQTKTGSAKRKHRPVLRRRERTFVYVYSIVLALVVGIQTLCLLLLWRPPQDWISFGARFLTSPAIAGIFAVMAAGIGAWQLSEQLGHTKKKTADEAWWQQFEWTTDRIISSQKNGHVRLPSSLAFALMASLSKSTRTPFQKDAVEGIVNHYLKEMIKQHEATPDPGEKPAPGGIGGMDAAGADSLRNLLDVLPESSPSSESADHVLRAYDYEQEILKALGHHGFEVFLPSHNSEIDAIVSYESKKALLDIKLRVRDFRVLMDTGSYLRTMMMREGIPYGMIIAPPTNLDSALLSTLTLQGIHLVEWEPSMGSSALSRQIRALLSDKDV